MTLPLDTLAHVPCVDRSDAPEHLRPADSECEGGAVVAASPSRISRWAMAAIVWYQRAVHGRPSPCRFTPSCSAYALECFDTHSSGRAVRLTTRRFTRCRPFGPFGYDPVPEPSTRHLTERHLTERHVEDC